jgi:uncharacterized protein (TIGR03545 family)
MIQKKPLVLLGSMVGVIVAVNLLLSNGIVKGFIETELETVFGTTVEIGSTRVSLNPFGVTLRNVMIGDKSKQGDFFFESPKVRLNLSFKDLKNKNFVINHMDVAYTSATLQSMGLVQAGNTSLMASAKTVEPVASLDTSVFSKELLLGSQEAGQLQSQLVVDMTELTQELSFHSDQHSLGALHDSIIVMKESIKDTTSDRISNVDSEIEQLSKHVNAYSRVISEKRNRVDSVYNMRRKAIDSLTQRYGEDITRLQAQIPNDLGLSDSLSSLVLGDVVQQRYSQFYDYTQFVSGLFSRLTSSDSAHNFSYDEKVASVPRLWIKSLVFTNDTDHVPLKILNISSNQAHVGNPVRVQYNDGVKQVFASYYVNRVLTQIYSIKQYPQSLSNYSVYNSDNDSVVLNRAIQESVTDVEIIGNTIDATSAVTTSKFDLSKSNVDDLTLSGILSDTLKTLDVVNVECSVSGNMKSPEILISSSLDSVVNNRFQTVASTLRQSRVEQFKEDITAVMTQEKEKLLATLDHDYGFFLNILESEEARVASLVSDLAFLQKELTMLKDKYATLQQEQSLESESDVLIKVNQENSSNSKPSVVEQESQAFNSLPSASRPQEPLVINVK